MEFIIEQKIDCSKIKPPGPQSRPSYCSDLIVEKLIPEGIKLRADKATDTVNGHITIDHNPKNHIIHITIYDKNEKPNNKHLTTFQKPQRMPTLDKLKKLIKAK